MAAQQPPPDCAAFRAASQRVHRSTNQIAQASANVPGDLVIITTELEQLEHQPTNAALVQLVQQMRQDMQQQLSAMNHNLTARMINSTLQDDADPLSPLVHQQTNVPIAGFPASSMGLAALTWAQKRALGTSLGMNVPAGNANRDARATFFAQLRTTIGLRPRRPA